MSVDQPQPAADRKAAEALAIVAPPTWFLYFARALRELQGTELDWLELLEKPWKWAHEYSAWCLHGHPSGADEAGWQGFVDELAD
jgi:hypothetical protein